MPGSWPNGSRESLIPDVEADQLCIMFGVAGSHLDHVGQFRATAEPSFHMAHGFLFTTKHRFDTAIRQVTHPAGQSAGFGLLTGEMTEPDSLNPPTDQRMYTDFRHR
eukprot:Anaeramoba_flamelloidesa583712_10.p2 GENE.a583712_10~~a583712_10.p2  ORF type:complete len:122 (+),score=3.14 a583712_10:46-366(+)